MRSSRYVAAIAAIAVTAGAMVLLGSTASAAVGPVTKVSKTEGAEARCEWERGRTHILLQCWITDTKADGHPVRLEYHEYDGNNKLKVKHLKNAGGRNTAASMERWYLAGSDFEFRAVRDVSFRPDNEGKWQRFEGGKGS